MLFNSFDFALFLPIVFFLYWFVFDKNLKFQNFLLVVSSYIFYGWWDWKFLLLILFSTIVDFLMGMKIYKTSDKSKKRLFLWISLIFNLGLLGFFKYYNFFLESFITAFSFFGSPLRLGVLNIILPVGISFYTFQTLSYTIDIYKDRMRPNNKFLDFAAFVSFFPQLVAGPIERAKNFLPQFEKKRNFNYSQAVDGMRQILWGLFKKLVIADNCAIYVNYIFENSNELAGSTLILGVMFFIIQLYGDFSGYSDIAIGTGRLFGFRLMQNFAYPLFARDIPEFWRRWHISLTTWFRDYVYIPLSRHNRTKVFRVRNIFVLFILTGLWHGANWTFVVWGGINAVYFLPFLLSTNIKSHKGVIARNSILPSFYELFSVLKLLLLVGFAGIFFRARNFGHACEFISRILSSSVFESPYYSGLGYSKSLILLIIFFFTIEWFGRKQKYGIEKLNFLKSSCLRWLFYTLIIVLIGVFMLSVNSEFIYFQF